MTTKQTINILTTSPFLESIGIRPEVSSFANVESSVEVSLDEAPTSAEVNANKLNTCTRVNAYSVNRRSQRRGA